MVRRHVREGHGDPGGDAMQARQRPYVALEQEFRDGRLSPRTVLEECIAAIEACETEIGAFAHLDLAAARDQATAATARWQRGEQRSAIDGMPIGVKDVIDTYDQPTEYGSRLFAGHQPVADAACVHALREAGALILGKTVTTEFSGAHPGRTKNPHDTSRTPGGSSSGSAAAVATGMVPAALGTQALASVIRPASYCGIYGYKPSAGGLNRGGVLDVNSQSVLGTLAATLADAWAVAVAIATRAGGDPGHGAVRGTGELRPTQPQRIGFLPTPDWSSAPDDCRNQLTDLLTRLTDTGSNVAWEAADLTELNDSLGDVAESYLGLTGYERRWPLQAYAAVGHDKLGERTVGRLGNRGAYSEDDYRAAVAARHRLRQDFAALQGDYDVLITLASAGPAPAIEGGTGPVAFGSHATFLGVPAVTVPGLVSQGLPVGIQLIGFHDCDHELLDHAAWLDTWLRAQ